MMAIVIVDEYVMLYSRVALAWEEVPDKIDFQNDFIGGKATADSLLRKVEGEPQKITIEDLTIRLNTELAKKPPECLEYIVVHEMAHLLEPTHNARFRALMDRFMPKWQFYLDQLNRLPVSHEEWAF